MKFTKIKRKRIYEEWQNKNRKSGLASYIHKMPKSKINKIEYFHFSILCYKCKDKVEKCKHHVSYSSLTDGKTFNTFDDCINAILMWYFSRR